MFVLSGNDVNDVYPMALTLLKGVGRPEPSRYGDVIVAPRPVTSHYENPRNRVLLDPTRDANPFFHLMEALWILAGRDDVAWLARFNNKMREFSDDGDTFHAAYGDRLRRCMAEHHPQANRLGCIDQLDIAVEALRLNPADRRVVLSIWSPEADLFWVSKDIPCNDMIKLEIRDGRLNLIVFNRSNDIIWGCYGANVVQFSMIQEYLAGRIGCEVGFMEQVSTNWHAYDGVWGKFRDSNPFPESPYQMGTVEAYPMVADGDKFDDDLLRFMARTERFPDVDTPFLEQEDWGMDGIYANPFFNDVAEPMYLAWVFWKAKQASMALAMLESCMASDWQAAGQEWIRRRINK